MISTFSSALYRNSISKMIIALTGSMGLFGCGGDSGNGSPSFGVNNDVPVTIGVSDAAVESLQSVVIQIDEITLLKSDNTTERFQRFFDVNTNEHSLDTLSVDLLQYQGTDVFNIIRSQDLDPATYTQVTLDVRDTVSSDNYVITDNGAQIPLEVANGSLQLPGFTLTESDANSSWVIEFDLRASLTFTSSPQAQYVLGNRGIRIENQTNSSTLSGSADISTLNAMASCGDPNTGNVVYLYPADSFELGLTSTQATSSFAISSNQNSAVLPFLADQFDPQVATTVPDSMVAPTTSIAIDAQGRYTLAFLSPGAYILAYSCTADADFADTFDEITITDFPDQLMHIYLAPGEEEVQNLP